MALTQIWREAVVVVGEGNEGAGDHSYLGGDWLGRSLGGRVEWVREFCGDGRSRSRCRRWVVVGFGIGKVKDEDVLGLRWVYGDEV